MSLRTWIGNAFGFYSEIERLQIANTNLSETIESFKKKDIANELRIRQLQDEATKLLGEIDMIGEQLPKADPMEKIWNEKYPKADITYSRYMMVSKGTEKFFNIDVRLFIQPNDFVIQNDLTKNKLMVGEQKSLNKLIPKIYHLAKKNYKYSYDDDNFGFGEVWLFPFELRELRKINKAGDCEDWSHKIVSYLISAGVPDWRVRVVCGDTKGGFGGHSTVYVLDDGLETWRHLNSTTPYHKFDDLTLFPTSKDEDDKFGIGNVWLSFNNKYSWHVFETKTSAKNYKKEKAMLPIKIKPKTQKKQENSA